jgi:hypothetical protein
MKLYQSKHTHYRHNLTFLFIVAEVENWGSTKDGGWAIASCSRYIGDFTL